MNRRSVFVAAERAAWPGQIELRAHLCGVGLWTPQHVDFRAWVAGGMPSTIEPVNDLAGDLGGDLGGRWSPPVANLLHPRLRRRTSTLTRAAVTTTEAALAGSGVTLDQVRFVLVSSYGEIETTVELLSQLADPAGPVSPTKFHNSVHNTATGYLSIASGNNLESTAVSGGPHNLEIGLLEALSGLAETGGHAVLIFGEELLPKPFARTDADPSFAVALHLCADRPTTGTSFALELTLGNRPALPNAQAGDAHELGHGIGSMFGPLAALLREIERMSKPGAEPGSQVALTCGRDLAVEAEWVVSLRAPT